MDWQVFEDWCLGRYRKAEATVYYNMGRLHALERDAGLDVEAFLRDPDSQERERNRVVAELKRQGRSANSVRTFQKSLNWLVDYARVLQPHRAWARGDLEAEVRSEGKSVATHLLKEFWTCRPEDDYDTRLQRALAWMAHHLRGRRGEIHRLQDDDLDPQLSCVRKRHPSKRGVAGWIPVPTFFWDPDKPLMHYLAVRVDVPGSKALWRRRHGITGAPIALSYGMIYDHLVLAGRKAGHPLSFIRTRRGSSTHLDDTYSVHPRVGQFLLSHTKQESWSHYVGRVTLERAVAHLQKIGVPGFENHPLAPPLQPDSH